METGKTLFDLKLKEQGSIHHVEGSFEEKQKLFEMGFVAGTPITYVMKTAFSDPRVYQLRGATLALRASDAQRVYIT